jgi:hypothetical protein
MEPSVRYHANCEAAATDRSWPRAVGLMSRWQYPILIASSRWRGGRVNC